MKTQICIIGAGPAGLMASIFSAGLSTKTVVINAGPSPGQKLLLTGGGRCNLTHQAEPKELVREYGNKGRFLSYSLYEFSPRDVREFFSDLGLQTKVEKASPERSREEGCVFPVTESAADVRDVLVSRAKSLGVKFLSGRRITDITYENGIFIGLTGKEQIYAEKLIIATGGLSWPKTGCTGDGYRFAQKFGHHIVEPRPALVPLVARETWPGRLAGTALENVRISAHIRNKKVTTTGALVFTGDGIGGPAVQDMSWYLTDYLPAAENPIEISLDLIPHLEQYELESQITKRIAENPKKKVVNILAEFVPKRFSVLLCGQAGCDEQAPAGQLKKDVRKQLIKLTRALPLSILRTRPIDEATVTRGGIDVAQVNPKTMESKLCPGLFFAGEVLDVDGPCGGYNLQICWSTGALAGSSAAG
jgi:predicted Rossmann fold flavoprotein